MFFDIFSALCKQKGISIYKAATDIGLNRAAATKWKRGAVPSGVTLSKLSDYFGVTTDYLLGAETEKAPTPEGERTTSEEDLKLQVAAFWGGGEDLSKEELDGLWSDAEGFYKFKLEQLKKSRSKQ